MNRARPGGQAPFSLARRKERTARFKEAVELIQRLWTEERLSFDGQFYKTGNATIYERPSTTVPLFVAGSGPVMAKFAGEKAQGFICTSGKAPRVPVIRAM